MEDAIKELLNDIEINSEEIPYFGKKGYKPFVISKDNFSNIQNIKSDKKICFVDGGNQEIIGAHNFSFQLIRVYYCVFKNNKKIESKIFENYVLISTKKVDNKLVFVSKFFSKNKKDEDVGLSCFNFDIDDSTLSSGASGVNISNIGDALRRFYEISVANFICDKRLCDLLVMDGTLEVMVTKEKEEIEKLYKSSEKNNVSIFSIAKTSSLITENGKSLLGLLNGIGPKNVSWLYNHVVDINNENHKVFLYIAKLHPKSGYVFRIEKYKNSKIDTNEFFSILCNNSSDAVFLGYPYGLIVADKFARVQNKEIEMLKMKLFSTLGKDFEKIRYTLNSKNAHDILDNIS